MNKRSVLQKIIVCALVIMGVNDAFCNVKALTECPTVEELKALAYEGSFPYGFDNRTKRLKALVVAGTADEDPNANSYGLMIYPMGVAAGPIGTASENPETNMRLLIGKLKLETSLPMTYNMGVGVSVNVCAYSLPGNNEVTALVYGDSGYNDDETDDDMSNGFGASSKQHKHAQVRNLMMKHMLFK